jgi:hypothetical protein
MKRKFILMSICFLYLSAVHLTTNAQDTPVTTTHTGQEKKDGGFAIGPKGGVSINKLKGDNSNVKSTDDRTGAVVGGFANISFLRVFSIQPEIFFSQKGGAASDIDQNTSSRYKLSYMEVPILFKLRLPIDRTFFPHVFIGPDIAYRIYSDGTTTNNTNGVQTDVEDTKVRRLDTGGVLGAGLDVQSTRFFFTLDGRYGFSFNTLGDGANLNVRHKSVVILAGFGIRFSSKKDCK